MKTIHNIPIMYVYCMLHIDNSFVTRFPVSHALIISILNRSTGKTYHSLLALGRHVPSHTNLASRSDQLLLVGIIYILRFVPRLNHRLLACYRKQGLIHYVPTTCPLKKTYNKIENNKNSDK